MPVITETCGCGATFTATTTYSDQARTAASQWREEHKHAESVGICGHRPKWAGPAHIPIPHCVLKAGHAGLHGDGDGAHWTHPTEETRP